MRRRSYAVHAASFDEYKTESLHKASASNQASSSPYQRTHVNPERMRPESRLEALKISREQKKNDANLWKEFDFKAKPKMEDEEDSSGEISQASTAEELSACDSPLRLSGEFSSKISTITSNIMVIGTQDAETHKFLDTIFDNDSNKCSIVNNTFDLVIKEYEANNQRYKFKFWIQDPEHHKHQDIINVYYKTIQSYLFIYKATTKQTLATLSEAIEKVVAKVNKDKFLGVLIYDTTELTNESKQEFEEEIRNLKEKYGLFRTLEKSCSATEVVQELAKSLNRKLEGESSGFSIQKCLNKPEII